MSQSWGYAGLFGNADSISVVKNINLTGASVNSMNSCVGIAAGFSAGTLQGISVEGTVLNSGRFTGGMAGIARNVEGCSAIVTVEGDNGTTGGLVGQLTGNLSKSHAQAIVYSSQANVGNPAGGLVALVRATDSVSAPVISDSYATGTVYAHYNSGQYVGGLVGSMFYGKVQRCFANTSVTCGNNTAVAGGLVGASIAAQLKDCYSTGTVYSFGTPAPHTGGITGLMSYLTVKNGYATDTIRGSMENCITTCRLDVEVDAYDNARNMREITGVIDAGTNPVIKNCYFDRQMENLGSVHGRALTTFLTSGKALPGYSTDVWTFTQGVYPRLKGMEDTPEAQLAASAIHFDTTVPDGVDYISKTATISTLGTTELYVVKGERDYSKTGSVCRIDGNKILLTGGMGADTLAFRDAKNPNVEPRLYAVKAAPASFTGEGTEANPFLITNKADLVKLSQLTSNYQQTFANVYFKQTADIDLQLDPAFHGIAAYNDAYYNSSVHKFCGTYDGDGHTIHKMKLAWIDWNVAPGQVHFGTPNTSGPHIAKDKGFIGVLGQGGVLKNLNIASDCQIELWSYSGALVGDNHGLVENCRNYADVTGYDQSIGGLVGESRIGSIIRNCFNAGNVKAAFANVAGIASNISGTVIENCANTGNVVADTLTILHTNTSGAAGLVNYMAGSSITNCLNAGHVFAHTSASGIVNSAASSLVVNSMRNDIKGVLNYGTVFADSAQENTIAAFASSDINASAQVSGNYFDAQLTGLTALNRNTVKEGITAAKTVTLTSGKPLAGLSDSVYVYNAGMYPMLKKFADEPTAVKAAKLIVYVAGGRTTRTICGNSMLSNAEGTTWKLERGNYFGISGDTLTLSGTLTVKRNDVLTGTLDGYSRPVKLTAMPALALDGTGSEDDPYLIKNRTDWNNVSKYMTRWDYTFNGEWLRVANDFTLASGTMREWGNAGAVPFAGTLDGAGHTISGIHYEPTQTFSGIINVLSKGGVIRDLTLQGHATLEHQQSGVWTGRAYGSFINCHNKVALTTKAVNTANFAGYCTGTVRFEGCTNDTTLTAAAQSVAGFVGLLSADGATFTDCQNNGDITCTASVNELAGIAVGDATATYVRCGNNGNITSAGRCVAGLQANIEAKTLPLVASGCYNTGTITATGSSTVYSGAAGLFLRLGTESQLTDCYNAGTVTAGAANYVAGLWAGTYTYTEKPASIERCYNTAAISGKNHVAGLGGHAGWITNVTSCYNTGTVVAAGYGAAGLVAESGKDAVISDSWNAASVTAADSLAGGILGATDAGHVTIAHCFNAGSVAAPAITGGVAGEGNLTLTGCYNAGDVTGTTQAAGLVGQPHIATTSIAGTTIDGCYNSGRVQATASGATAVGALVANHDAAHWDASCNIAGSCYVTDFNGTLPADAVGGTAVTVKQLAAADGDQSALAGDGWNYGDSYTYPMIASIGDNDCAKANAAAVVVNDGDSYDHVTGTFWVGLPEGATWSFNSDAIDLKGNNAYVTRACNDTVLATVTCGNYSRTWKLKLDVTSGVDANLAQKPIVSRTYYNVAGQQSNVPFPGINIVVTRYSDGTTTSRKVVK